MRSAIGGAILLTALCTAATSQSRNAIARHCLAITDVNARVDCLETGILPEAQSTITPQQAPALQPSPSFDCRAAKSSMERAICTDVTLAQWDALMGRTYQQALRTYKDRQALFENQRSWLTQRETACSSVAGNMTWSCILDATKLRVTFLNKIANSSTDQSPTPQVTNPVSSPPTQTRLEPPIANPINSGTRGSKTSTAVSDDDGFPLITGLAVLVCSFVALKLVRNIWRRRYLTKKYGPQEAAQIMAREVWQGMTAEQLTESRGRPADIGREIIRTRTKETWKYGQTGKNRFQNRIYLEDGIVIGWKI
ncbi:lysozyme inhibitor LprI family protein [Bradyrhizobium sp. AT1]|uniref:lysozyme inhibitor LprI family protein n=1 Tax=Bradyrhizobium sp. AT1 TaxID=574934 RepID=UPI0024C0E33C|nr:lysozyme inhibitor LprI family protein [Bradyrhizobium sp. AT1]